MNFILKKVEYRDKKEIIKYIKEMYKYNSAMNGFGRLQDFINEEKNDFDGWYNKIKLEEISDFPKICYVMCKEKSDYIYGMVNIRMVPDLGEYEFGHIGYSIRPKERGKGLSELQLYFSLNELYKNKIETCLMVCDKHNIRSKRTIKSLGGIFESEINNEEHYLINVKKSLKENKKRFEKYIV